MHIYGKTALGRQSAISLVTFISHIAFSRIKVCGYLLSVTTRGSQHLLPSNSCARRLLLAGVPLQEFPFSFTAAWMCTYSAGATYKPLIYCIYAFFCATSHT